MITKETISEICMWGAITILGIVAFKDVVLKAVIDWWII